MKDNDHSKNEIPKKEKLEETFTTVLDINYDILKVASPKVEGGTERLNSQEGKALFHAGKEKIEPLLR